MTENPFFSVIIPLYNKERDIANTLKSLSLQSFQNFEVVIVDDGSTDRSLEIARSHATKQHRIFTKANEGVAPTRNFGVEKAESQYVVFLDADDYWYPYHLEDLKELIDTHPEGSWYATAYEKRFNDQLVSSMIAPILNKGPEWKGPVSNFFENSLVDCLAWTSAVCFEKSFFQALNGFDTSITMGAGEDTDLWLRAALKAPLVFSNRISASHNLQGSNRISNSPTLDRNFMDLDRYEDEATKNQFLKKYLDLNRYSFALQHRFAGDENTFKEYISKLNRDHLNAKQRFLLNLPRPVLSLFVKLKSGLEKLGIRTTSF